VLRTLPGRHFVSCAEYLHACSFFAEAQRIAAEGYVPSIEDIGHASKKGVIETRCNVGMLSLRVLHVCYSANCQEITNWYRKWLHLFDGVTSILFCVSLSDYDEPASGISSPRHQVRASTLCFPCDNHDTRDDGLY
jgi:hypothetical protein